MHVIDVIILVGWVVFWLFWFAAAIGVKAGKSRWGQFAGIRVLAILVFLLVFHLRVFKGNGLTSNPWLQGIGTAIFVLGLALAVWARLYIGRNWGMPMTHKDNPDLVTTGPYHAIRHPIYTGIILGMLGTALAITLYYLIAVAVLAGYFVYSAVNEERYMTEQFPDQYPEYKAHSKMLIPFVF